MSSNAFCRSLFAILLTVVAPTAFVQPRDEFQHYFNGKGQVRVLFGNIVTWDADASCHGDHCVPGGMMRLQVLSSFGGRWKGSVLIDLPIEGEPARVADKLTSGETVFVVFREVRRPAQWACGTLRSCSGKTPESILLAADVYRRAQW